LSDETSIWLNTKTLIGNTDVRGMAWHYRAENQGERSNHYPRFIPVEDVIERLFNWEPILTRVFNAVPVSDEYDPTPERAMGIVAALESAIAEENWAKVSRLALQMRTEATGEIMLEDMKRSGIQRLPGVLDDDDPGGVYEYGGKDTYALHPYRVWLIEKVAHLLDDELGITSAGLLREGGLAWVEVSVPEAITTPEGVTFLPNILAGTSFNQSLSSTYKKTAQATVCDNTFAVAMSGTDRAERNMLRALYNETEDLNRKVLTVLGV
jgi:hypothetical protein